jgi:asparagine synthase (glutamine-hydrolysing)
MCGICGKINFNSKPIDEGLIRLMSGVLSHRGPNDEGAYIDGNIGLGHRRLSIIDLSEAARQPMHNEDKSIWIVFNGEIYNFRELRKDLEARGHRFISKSDTEVIIHLYEERGIDCVKDLRGMFAFAVWDKNRQRLFLARDRAGKKPLHYALRSDSLIFASEIKSILKDPTVSLQVDRNALDLYLAYQYVPAARTIFSGIRKLPPAHILVCEGGRTRIEPYWRLLYGNKIKMGEAECAKRLMDLLTEATQMRLISDVPLGAFLSGGIDSSAVVAIMSRLSAQPVKTFSIGFNEQSFNELKFSRIIAKLFHTDHHEYMVKPDLIDILPKLIWHFNEPFGDPSAIPTYYLSKMARNEVTVALSGDGGDESFGGYQRYAANRLFNLYCLIPHNLRRIIALALRVLPESTRKKDFVKRLKRFTAATDFSRELRYAYLVSLFDSGLRDRLYTQDFKTRLNGMEAGDYICDAYSHADTGDFLDSTLHVDVLTYLPNDLLVKVDIASMANSLEVRSPFLDHKLMEFAASIPSNLKLKGMTCKYILKEALAKVIPPKILQRQKCGFGVPIGSWLRGELKDYACEILLSNTCLRRGYFRDTALKGMLDEHISGRIDHGHRLFSLINLELWHRIFID